MKNNTRGSEEHITKSHLLIIMLSEAMLSNVILSDKSLYWLYFVTIYLTHQRVNTKIVCDQFALSLLRQILNHYD